MGNYVEKSISIENARIGWKNFAGKAGKFNKEGDRDFTVFLDEETGLRLLEEGWNIGFLEPREEGDSRTAKLQVKVSYRNIPPKIVLISCNNIQHLDEEAVSMLDWVEIENIDLIINPYNWTMYEGTKNEKHGVSAYLKAMYVTVVVDEFEEKYRK